MSGDVVKVGQVWRWDDGRGLVFKVDRTSHNFARIVHDDGVVLTEYREDIAKHATLVTDVPDPEPTPLDALAAAAVAWEAAVRLLDNGEWPYAGQVQANLHDAAIDYARSVREVHS